MYPHSIMATERSTADVCSCVRPTACVDRQEGRYLVVVRRTGADRDGRVRTGEVSDRLGVSPASVTEMFERLAADGLVEYQKQKGVTLTSRGMEVALELALRQCTVQTFFRRQMGFDLSADAGYQIGYLLPEQGIERLQELVERSPDECCWPVNAEAGQCPFGAVKS